MELSSGRLAARVFGIAVLTVSGLGLGLAPAVADENLGTFGSWSAIVYTVDGKKVCSAWAQPRREEGQYTQRGEVYAFVNHTVAERRFHELTFDIGYTFKSGSKLTVNIDRERYVFTTHGGNAWNPDRALDRRIARALRAGRRMVVEGVSSRGTKTRDEYSLRGFTKAHKRINKACKAPF